MPYIKPERKEKFDGHIDRLAEECEVAGDLSYVITRLSHKLAVKWGINYDSLSNIHKALVGAEREFYRKVLEEYEERAIERNGDVSRLPFAITWINQDDRTIPQDILKILSGDIDA